MIDENVSWTSHIEFTCKKIQQRIYFLQRLRSFEASRQIISLFFMSVIQSVMLYCNTAQQSCLSVKDKANYILKFKLVQRSLDYLQHTSSRKPTTRSCSGWPDIFPLTSHVLHREYQLLPSNRRFRVPSFNRNRLKYFFIHQSILLLNQ